MATKFARILLIGFVSFILSLSNASAESDYAPEKAPLGPKCDWAKNKPVFEKAVKTGYRADIRSDEGNCWPEIWIKAGKYTFPEKVEMYKLFIEGAGGFYSGSDLITQIGGIIDLYNNEIIKKDSDEKSRVKLFREELNTLIGIFQFMDKQIYTSIKFHKMVQQEFSQFLREKLKRKPSPEEMEMGTNGSSSDDWKLFIDQNTKYRETWPGFMSSTIEEDLQERLEENFHLIEIFRLKKGLEKIRDKNTLSVKEYEDIVCRSKTFTDNLGWAVEYCPSCCVNSAVNTTHEIPATLQ